MVDQLGIDCSNFGGIPSTAALDELVSMGVQFAIPGTQIGLDGKRYTQQQITAFESRGIHVPSVYCYLNFDGNDPARVVDALQFGKYVWLDVEEQSTNVGMLRDAVAAAGDRVAGIYTGRYYPIWQHAGTEFAYLPLWHADYRDPSQADEIFDHFVPYAGWTRPAVWQFRGTTHIAGFGVDLNLYRVLTPDPEPPLPPVPNPTTRVDHVEIIMTDGTRRIFREVM